MSAHYGYMQMPAGPYDPSQIPQIVPSPTTNVNLGPSASTSTHNNGQLADDTRKRKFESDGEDDDDDGKGTGKDKKERTGASDFVKKLYKMLDEAQFPDTVSWGDNGDTFVVKDMNTFTRTILPLHFKHSNFASFVRQLNKYDFHKVKYNTVDPIGDGSQTQSGDQIWEFKHPSFKADMKESLEHIKRKAPARGAKAAKTKGATASPSPNDSYANQADIAGLQAQIDSLHRGHQQTIQHLNGLSQDYSSLFAELMNFQRNMVAQDQLMQNLIQYLVHLEQESTKPEQPFVPSSQAQKLISSYTTTARQSYEQMAEFSRRASLSSAQQNSSNIPPVPMPPPNFGQFAFGSLSSYAPGQPTSPVQQQHQQQQQQHAGTISQPQQQQQHQQQQHGSPATSAGAPTPRSAAGSSSSISKDGTSMGQPSAPQAGGTSMAPARNAQQMRGWKVPPRVLLVEDDAVCRKLSSKFLQLFGCDIDVAVDGVSAVNKMNAQKYDLVLMDIMMPNLDGVSATSLIRQFDPSTPIISMTSNSSPNEIMTYFSHGMNDILPKPFTKEGLLDMLEKHLDHFKVVQQMAEIPRALGFSADQIHDALAASVMVNSDGGEGGGNTMNPFASMGISDTDYVEMLQGIAMQSEGKRAIEVVHDQGDANRARFALFD